MFSKDLLNAFKAKIDNASTIAIFGHESVDGDAVGSMLGLGLLCEKLGKKVGYFTTLPPSRSYLFLPDIGKIQTEFDYSDNRDLIIFVDFNGYGRIRKLTEGREEYFDTQDKIIVDHHLGDDIPTTNVLMLRDTDASSNCELLYEICKELYPELLDADMATRRLLGLLTDTGSFQYEKDSVRTFGNAMGLMELGANKSWIIEKLFNSNDITSIDLLKTIIPRITFDKHICYVWYTQKEIDQWGFDKDEADVLIFSNIKPIKDIPVFVIIRQGDERVGISLRSGYMANGKRVNVQQIATQLGGGGHIYAAGGRQPIEPDFNKQVTDLVKKINDEIEKQL